eukprot:jgi/Psemu1/253558/estExt_Genewise1Plus.C_730025
MTTGANDDVVDENHGPSPPKVHQTTTETVDNDNNDNDNNDDDDDNAADPSRSSCHEKFRIALYYIYIQLTPSQVRSHIDTQRAVCEKHGLKGRIRVSTEGINGVLSGRHELLRAYERAVSKGLGELRDAAATDQQRGTRDSDPRTVIDLDVKYCRLREDLPLEKQLFDHLMVKETKNVIGLFDESLCGKQRQQQQQHKRSKSERALRRTVMEEPLNPARHLSPGEWNEKLDALSSSSSSSSNNKSALLLDVRNVYEMKVGHFAHPSAPTLLTNTRKYSDLPKMLASNRDLQERDQIFMYCTGGVRCERVSMLVRELYPDKEIYQLRGGIQRYLETSNPGYFVGKNFVFDPRRTDPVHFGETVGRCLVCEKPHDDYDNGHAPNENKEARCNNCRMLVLICNECRPNYMCHGEKDSENEGGRTSTTDQNESRSSVSARPLLYCNLDQCIHEGSSPDAELRVFTK